MRELVQYDSKTRMYVTVKDGKLIQAELSGDLLDVTSKLTDQDKEKLIRKVLTRNATRTGKI